MPLAAIFIAIIYSVLTAASVQRLQYEALYRSARAVAADARLLIQLQENLILGSDPVVDLTVPDDMDALSAALGGAPIVLTRDPDSYEFVNLADTPADPLEWVLRVDLTKYIGDLDEARNIALNAAIEIGGGALANAQTDSGEIGTIEVPVGILYLVENTRPPWLPRTGIWAMEGDLDMEGSDINNVDFLNVDTARMDTISVSNFEYLPDAP